MSRGHGKLERMILAAVEAGWPAYLIDLLPVAHTRAQAVALQRAARNLARQGTIDLGYDQRPDLTVGTKSESTVGVTHLVPRPAKEGGADLRKPSDLAIRRLFRESVVSNL